MKLQPGSKILIIQTAFLGDVVLATSVIERIRKQVPGVELHFVLRKGNEGLMQGHPHLRKLWVWDKKKKYSSLLKLVSGIRKEKFDLVINLQRFATSGLITIFSGAGERRGFSKNPLSPFFHRSFPHVIEKGMHEVQRNLSLLEGIASTKGIERPVLYPSKTEHEKVQHLKEGSYICMAPASVWFTKQFPAKKWIELIKAISPETNIYLIGSKADKELCGQIITGAGSGLNLAGNLTLLQTAALMKDAAMNYVNDSAPMHIASAMNAPVTAIYCSTVPEFGFGPLSDLSNVVQVENLYCKPCGLHGYQKCPESHFRCAWEISIQAMPGAKVDI